MLKSLFVAYFYFLPLSIHAKEYLSAYQIIGIGPDHLAIRELFKHSECCGALEIKKCNYPGIKAVRESFIGQDKLDLLSPNQAWEGINIHFLPLKNEKVINLKKVLGTQKSKDVITYKIFKSANKIEECSNEKESKDVLSKMHKMASNLNIKINSDIKPKLLQSKSIKKGKECTGSPYSPPCHGKKVESLEDISDAIYYVLDLKDNEDTPLSIFINNGHQNWIQISTWQLAQTWLMPPLKYTFYLNNSINIYQYNFAFNKMSDSWSETYLIINPDNGSH